MPRNVEPILSLPLSCSLAASSNRWVGKIRWAFREMSSRASTSTPCSSTSPISRLQRHRVNHHAVANQIQLTLTKNATWDGVQHMFSTIKLEGVTSIRPALKAGNDVVLGRQYIHDFPLPLVSPLETKQYVNFHVSCVRLQKYALRQRCAENFTHVLHLISCAVNPPDGPLWKHREPAADGR